MWKSTNWLHLQITDLQFLIHCSLMMPICVEVLDQQWLSLWFVSWWYRAITWTNVDCFQFANSMNLLQNWKLSFEEKINENIFSRNVWVKFTGTKTQWNNPYSKSYVWFLGCTWCNVLYSSYNKCSMPYRGSPRNKWEICFLIVPDKIHY